MASAGSPDSAAAAAPASFDLDGLPFPDRRLTQEDRKHYFSEWMRPLASIRTSKGCPHRCRFCALWTLTGGAYLKRSPERVVEELAQIEEECVFFADDESLVDTRRMRDLAERIREAGLRKRFFLYGRSDTIARNPELLEAWREAGLERVFVGFEFFRDADLERIRKGSKTEDNGRAVRILHDLGLEIYASFIVRPEFGREDFAAFRDYCRGLRLNFASFAVLTPLPGTELYEEEKDRLITHDPALFDFVHTVLPTQLPLEAFYDELAKLYRGSLSLRGRLALMRRFSVREIPFLVRVTRDFYGRLASAHLDYAEA